MGCVFTVTDLEGDSELTIDLKIKPHTLGSRISGLFSKRAIKRTIKADMDALKDYCEK